MPAAKKEFILNYAMNRWQLNYKRNVGPTSESIRKCNPKTYKEWEDYYFANVRSREQIRQLGRELYLRIDGTLPSEKRFHPDLVRSTTEKDCIDYMFDVVLRRTYEGFRREYG